MTQSKSALLTPIYIKPRKNTAWPDDPVFYLLTGSGLFLCRNHDFFQSSVEVKRWPSELASHEAFLAARYPKIPRKLLERVVGFFHRVADMHQSEAAVLLAYHRLRKRVVAVVPKQLATVSRNAWGDVYPIGVEYEIPADLAPELVVLGDIHSHVDSPAYASYIDKHDETHRAGLHVVVGRIYSEPPQLHIEAVVDGTRFIVDESLVLEDYRRRRFDFPEAWLDKLHVEPYGRKFFTGKSGPADPWTSTHTAGGSGSTAAGGSWPATHPHPPNVSQTDPYGDFAPRPDAAPPFDAGPSGADARSDAADDPDKAALDRMAEDELDRRAGLADPPEADARVPVRDAFGYRPETTLKLGHEPRPARKETDHDRA